MKYDCVIRQALLFNGLDQAPTLSDVAVKEGVITKIAPSITDNAEHIQEAGGLWMTPGFIDIHTHYDIEVEMSPGLPESVRQGVTSIVMGNCSLSLTCGDPQTLADIFSRVETLPSELVYRWLKDAVQWDTPQDYFAHLRQLELGPNVSALLGHSALRANVMGLKRSLSDRATKQEIEKMRQLAEEALDAGCIGISVDMVHWHKVNGKFAGAALPSHHADYTEYKMLASVCRARDAVFQVTPNPRNPFSFIHILRLCTGLIRPPLRATILSALDMSTHPALWRLFPFITHLGNYVLNGNIRFQTLTEPFTIYADGPLTPLFEEFPTGVLLNSCHSTEERRRLWKDKLFQKTFRKEWRSKLPHTFHRDLSQMIIVQAPDTHLVGKTFLQVAIEQKKEPLAAFFELMIHYDEQLRWMTCGANQRPLIRQRLMSHKYILPGFSDAGAHSRHLAFFDSALSLIRQAVSTQFMSPQRAIKRVTSEPAAWFNLNTGVLREGAKADFVLLKPDKLYLPIPEPIEISDPLLDGAMRLVKRDRDPAIAHVFISGVEVVRQGEPLPLLGKKKTGSVLTTNVMIKKGQTAMTRYRNRIDHENREHPFTRYWDVFLMKHQQMKNAWFHCLAVILMYLVVILALYTQHGMWLLLLPLSQSVGLIGHYLYERSPIDIRDGIFSWRALYCLHRLFFIVLTGRFQQEITRVHHRLAEYKKSQL